MLSLRTVLLLFATAYPLLAWSAPLPGVLAHCPRALHAQVTIESFTLADSEDRDFATLSGESFELDLVALDSPHLESGDCLLMERPDGDGTTRRRFVEIREGHDGSLSIELAGYTPESHQLYSIRARTLPDVDGPAATLDGHYDAALFDGSGPSREKLSRAELVLEARDSD